MPTLRLTKKAVQGLKPTEKVAYYWDADLKGFALRVTPADARAWVVEYRSVGGGRGAPSRRMTLGGLGTLTIDQARKQARDILAAVRLGHDPAGDRTRQRETPTVAAVGERFLADEAARLKPGTLANYAIYLRKHIGPELGTLKINKVAPADVVRLHRLLGREKPVTANRVIEALGSIFRYAEGEGLVERGFRPTAGIKAYRESGRERFLSADELGRLGTALEEAEGEGIPWSVDASKPTAKHVPKRDQRTRIDPFAAAAIRLLIFTGCRLREVLHLRWQHVDFERGLLLLPDSKTGRKTIVLNAPALAILADLPRIGPFVVPGTDAQRPRADLKRPWELVTARAGLSGLRLHDLRHGFASIGVGGGMGLPIVGKLLGHTSAATTSRYSHLDADPLRKASNTIGATLEASLSRRPGAEVMPLYRGKSS
jgi:integrase